MMQPHLQSQLTVVGNLPLTERTHVPCSGAIRESVNRVSGFLVEEGWVCANAVEGSSASIESEWVGVRAVHEVDWPRAALLCAEVWYFLPAEFRQAEGECLPGEPLEAAEHRIERIGVLTETLVGAGFGVALVDRGWLGLNLLVTTDAVTRSRD
ncbi:hypothetical protein [Streptomyces anulatus]|uniref:hypothetical protein n=1 Tax=Streptomyces anulatus TaxID=1892 RepID=UPI00344A5EB6